MVTMTQALATTARGPDSADCMRRACARAGGHLTFPGRSRTIPGVAVLMYFEAQRGSVPALLWLTLIVVLYLTIIELRPLGMSFRVKAWWFSLALLTHFFGYLLLRGYVLYRHRSGEG
jgi:hypothetical protein